MKKLNLGCGEDYRADCVNLDILDNVKKDIKHDLNIYPWPFDDNEFDVVYCIDVLEHLEKPAKAVEEMHRICKNNAKIIIRSPHFSSQVAHVDLQHVKSFSVQVFNDYSGKGGHSYETNVVFNILVNKILFLKGYKYFWNYLVERLVNLSNFTKNAYETTFLWSLFPAQNVYFELKVIK